MPSRAYTDAELDAAIDAINDPRRIREAENVVARTAPARIARSGPSPRSASEYATRFSALTGVPPIA